MSRFLLRCKLLVLLISFLNAYSCLSQGVSDAELSAAKLKAKYAIAKRESKATKVARNIAIQQLTQGAPLSYEHAVQVWFKFTKQILFRK